MLASSYDDLVTTALLSVGAKQMKHFVRSSVFAVDTDQVNAWHGKIYMYADRSEGHDLRRVVQ
jgi:hypothetical protein